MTFDPRLVPETDLRRLRGERARYDTMPSLWTAGSLHALAAPSVAIVGSRAPTEAGRRLAWRFGRELASAGVCVVSGLALGIDGAAHAGAVSVGAPTIGVLAGGHRQFFPKRNLALAEAMIAHGGAVVSPYPPDEVPYPSRFLERNGVIVGLADVVVVVEAAQRSGALNTASWAADTSTPLMAVPGDVDRPKVAGCLVLIRDGATLVRNTADILEGLGLSTARPAATEQLPLPLVSGEQARILAILADGPAGIEQIADRAALPAPAVIAALALLGLEGLAIDRGDGTFARPGRE